jgi:catechol 2,3-dioxygenase-like lactoylglutathione lyase family enzyme
MAINGVHLLFFSPEAEALRATLRDAFGWPHVDAGGGWLIFATPPSEIGVHPADKPGHEISLTCDDLDQTMADLRAKGVVLRGEPEDRRFGRAITAVLPGGVEVLLYQPAQPTPLGNPQ